jgi:hypothetical protein
VALANEASKESPPEALERELRDAGYTLPGRTAAEAALLARLRDLEADAEHTAHLTDLSVRNSDAEIVRLRAELSALRADADRRRTEGLRVLDKIEDAVVAGLAPIESIQQLRGVLHREIP